nr:MAG TPA: Type II secretion system, protein M [Caudoviricetes sp.]
MNKILLIAALVLAGLVAFLVGTVKRQKAEILRLDNNVSAVTETARQYKTKAGDNAEEVRRLTLKHSELEMFNADLEKKVKEMGIKLRDVQAVNRMESETKIAVTVPNVTPKTVKSVNRFAHYFDGWNDVKVESRPDSTKIEVKNTDTLDVVTHVKQKRFLFFRVGKPIPKTTISNKNPKTELHLRFSAEID